MAFAGEEQGLIGARLHAQRATAEKLPVDAVFNNDIVGNATGGAGRVESARVRVFSDGPEDSVSRQLSHADRAAGRALLAGPPGDAGRALRPLQPRRRSHSVQPGGFCRGALHRSEGKLRAPAHGEGHPRTVSTPRTWRGMPRPEAAAVAVMALAPPAPSVTNERGQPMLSRQPSGYRDARLEGRARRHGDIASSGAIRGRWTGSTSQTIGNVTEVALPGVVHRRLGVRSGGDRSPAATRVSSAPTSRRCAQGRPIELVK